MQYYYYYYRNEIIFHKCEIIFVSENFFEGQRKMPEAYYNNEYQFRLEIVILQSCKPYRYVLSVFVHLKEGEKEMNQMVIIIRTKPYLFFIISY